MPSFTTTKRRVNIDNKKKNESENEATKRSKRKRRGERTQGVLGADVISDGSSLGLRGASGAPDLTLGLLEGVEVEDDTARSALEAELVVGVVTGLHGLKGVSVLSALSAGLGRHVDECGVVGEVLGVECLQGW